VRQRKSEVVLSSARSLFLDKGFSATTVDEIAEAAHVSKATVYSNFEDKAGVLAALLEQISPEATQILEGVVAMLDSPGPVGTRLERTAVALATGVLRPEVLQLRRCSPALSATSTPRACWWSRTPRTPPPASRTP
jgi:TetR/AcrR family transcriptional regulator, mexJK operon transcriptional repressor